MKKIWSYLQEECFNRKNLRILCSACVITAGVYLSFPEKGLLATLPLAVPFYLGAYFLFPNVPFCFLISFAMAWIYGTMGLLPHPVLFAAVCALSSFLAAVCGKGICTFRNGKKGIWIPVAVLCLAASCALPFFYLGTPFAHSDAKNKIEDYLQTHYPDQSFSQVSVHYLLLEKGYRALVSYDYQGNTLSSELFFGDEVQDGFLKDFTDRMMEKRKNIMIEIFRKNGFSVITEVTGLYGYDSEQVLQGSYGTVDENIIPKMHFSVTFRQEKPDRKEFAEACSGVIQALWGERLDYGMITFYALDAGNVVSRCDYPCGEAFDVTSLLSLVTSV